MLSQNRFRHSFVAALALILGAGVALADEADSASPIQQQQASPQGPFCVDGMETIPDTDDDGAAVPVSDSVGGCQVNDDTISI